MVHQVRRFSVGKGGDGISKASVGAGERLSGDVDGTGLAVGKVAGEGTTSSGGGTRAEDFWMSMYTLVSLPLQLIKAMCWLKAPSYILFHHHLYTPAMSTNSSQVGVALFPSL